MRFRRFRGQFVIWGLGGVFAFFELTVLAWVVMKLRLGKAGKSWSLRSTNRGLVVGSVVALTECALI